MDKQKRPNFMKILHQSYSLGCFFFSFLSTLNKHCAFACQCICTSSHFSYVGFVTWCSPSSALMKIVSVTTLVVIHFLNCQGPQLVQLEQRLFVLREPPKSQGSWIQSLLVAASPLLVCRQCAYHPWINRFLKKSRFLIVLWSCSLWDQTFTVPGDIGTFCCYAASAAETWLAVNNFFHAGESSFECTATSFTVDQLSVYFLPH